MLSNCGTGEDLRVLWTAKVNKPVNPKRDQPWVFVERIDAEIEAPILWPLDVKNWLIGKTLILGKIEGRRRKGWQRMRCLNSITDSMDMSLRKLQRIVKDGKSGMLQFMGFQRVIHDLWTKQQQQTTVILLNFLFTSCSSFKDLIFSKLDDNNTHHWSSLFHVSMGFTISFCH